MASVLPQSEVRSKPKQTQKQIVGIEILATGSYAPDNEVLNEDLAQVGFDAEWIEQRTGILARRHASDEQSTSDMAIKAAEACIASAGIDAREIDSIWLATMTPDHYTPSTACLVQRHLGCEASAVDMNAACSGFMYAFVTACQFVKSGGSRLALVIGADKMSCVVDDRDIKTFPLFGDGAGAALVRLADDPAADEAAVSNGRIKACSKGITAYRLASVGELSHTLVVPGGGSRMPCSPQMVQGREHYLKMEGKPVFKWAVRLIPLVIDEICSDAGLKKSEIDLFILHQANKRILDAAIDSMGVDPGKFFVNLHHYGNTSAASIPVALDEALQAGRIKPGDKVMLFGFGAGLSWGACVYQF